MQQNTKYKSAQRYAGPARVTAATAGKLFNMSRQRIEAISKAADASKDANGLYSIMELSDAISDFDQTKRVEDDRPAIIAREGGWDFLSVAPEVWRSFSRSDALADLSRRMDDGLDLLR